MDRPIDLELFNRPASEVLGYGGNRITLFDSEASYRKVGKVVTEQLDILAVECGVEWHHAVRHQFLCQICTDRMWNRVVHMEDIQIKAGHHVGHFGRENKIVGRVL